MPKRKREESKEDKWERKLKKYEEKLKNKRRNRIVYSSDDENDVTPQEHLELEEIPILEDTYADGASDYLAEQHNLPAVPPAEPDVITTSDEIKESENLDAEILEALGDCEIEKDEWGENIHPEIAQRFSHILINGLKKEQKQELYKKYLVPKNSPFAKAPALNPEVRAMLSETCKNRDKRFLDKQEQIGRALSALENAMTSLLKKDFKVPDIVRILNDTGKLLADSHYSETESRRFLIIPFVDRSLIESFKGRKRDSFLFGEKLDDLVKASRGIRKTSQQIATPSAPSSMGPGNWKSPSDRGRQQRSGQHMTRPGGQRTFSARGRAAPLPARQPQQPQRWTNQPPPPVRRPPPLQASRPPPLRPRHRPQQ